MAFFDPTDYGDDLPGGADGGALPGGGQEADGADGQGDDIKQLKDAVLVLIDCSSASALAPLKVGGRSLVTEALWAASTLLKRKVVSAPEDKIGVALYGVREKQNPNGFEGIRMLQELERPSAQRIKLLEAEMLRSPESFEERYGHGRQVPLSDVFWTCTTIFNLSANAKQFDPRIWLFTGTDSPCGAAGAEQMAAETRARDLQDMGVQIELFPLVFPGLQFSMAHFWDKVVPVDEEDYVGKTVVTLENLERWIRMREHRKRTLQRLNFQLCPGAEIAMSIFCTTIEARVPVPVHLLNENNKPLKSESKMVCAASGAILHPTEDVENYVELGGDRVFLTRREANEVKTFGEPGMYLLNFQPTESVEPHHRIFHSYFVYPNEKGVKGSSALCQSLIDVMIARRLVAIVRYIARRNAEAALVALVAQAEEVDEDGVQVRSPGFQMVKLPWAEEIRKVDLPAPEQVEPSPPELVAAARGIVQSMRLDGFRPGCAENPLLQKHYAAVQALALGEDQPAETIDVLLPDTAAIEAKTGMFEAWREAIDMAASSIKVAAAAGAKRGKLPAGDQADPSASPPAPKAPKKEALAAPTTLEEMRELVGSGEVARLTVSVLKDWLKGQGIVASGKKADLVERVRAVV